MRLISLHIDAFGKLRNFDLEFSSGITEILGENGYGKTTLAAFIKAMLYGIPDNRDKEKIRKKYAPWSGGDFGGTLDIETEKGRYRIARRFTPKTGDSFELYELATMRKSSDYGENIGFELFAVDAESFEKSAYLPQREVEIKMTDSIGARLSELLEGSNDMLNFSDALESIRSRRRELELYRGSAGLIEDTKNELSDCEKLIVDFENKLREAANMRNKAQELFGETEGVERDIAALSLKLREENERKLRQKDVEIYQSLCLEVDAAEARLERIRSEFVFGVPEESELSSAEELSREIGFLRKKRAQACEICDSDDEFASLDAAFGGHAPGAYELAKLGMDAREAERKRAELASLESEFGKLSKPERAEESNGRSKLSPLGAAALGIGAVCVILGFFNLPVLFIVGALVAAVGAIALIFGVSAKKQAGKNRAEFERAESEYRGKRAQLEAKQAELDALENALDIALCGISDGGERKNYELLIDDLAKRSRRYEELAASRRENERSVGAIDAKINENEGALVAFLAKYGFSGERERTPEEIRELVRELEPASAELQRKREIAEKFKAEKNISGDEERSEITSEQLEAALANAQRKLRELTSERSRLVERAEQQEIASEGLPYLKDKREALMSRITELCERRDVYDKTEKLLEKAKENLSSRYILSMKNSFCERFSEITENSREVTVDTKLEIKLRDEGGAKKSSEYSAGWQAAIALCLRLALIDALYGEERPFLMLDDPFVNLDNEKTARALGLLRELSKTTQIVYMTCHKSRSFEL